MLRTTRAILQDRKLEIYRDSVIIKDYYAPGVHRGLRISAIENVWVEKLTWLSGKLRMWGSGTFRRRAPFDLEREAKDKALIIRQKRGLIKEITITLDTQDPDRAYELLHDLLH
jgi:hypothetical protein